MGEIFLSTLSLRRATLAVQLGCKSFLFLSTLSLRRATHYDNFNLHCTEISIHALLAESDVSCMLYDTTALIFLSTLSLRRATSITRIEPCEVSISIHALLAESDEVPNVSKLASSHFYPRSPCGERLCINKRSPWGYVFLSTLSLRRATSLRVSISGSPSFLSTLSLRRATSA